MASVDNIRNSLITKLLAIKDRDFLVAIDKIISGVAKSEKVALSEEQMLMLQMSDQDIAEGKVTDQDELFDRHRQWLNGK